MGTCEHLASGDVQCTNIAGEQIGKWTVPRGEEPFASWLWDEIMQVAAQEGTRLRLVQAGDTGTVLWTQPPDQHMTYEYEELATDTTVQDIDLSGDVLLTARLEEECGAHGCHARVKFAHAEDPADVAE